MVTLCQTPRTHFGTCCRIPLGEDQPHLEILPEVIRNYGLAVQYGHRHIFQSLPRLLTLWFDFGSHIKSITGTQKVRPLLLNAHKHCCMFCTCTVSLVNQLVSVLYDFGVMLRDPLARCLCGQEKTVASTGGTVYTCANASVTYCTCLEKSTALGLQPSSFTHLCIYASICSPIHSPIHPPTHPSIHRLGSTTASPEQPLL